MKSLLDRLRKEAEEHVMDTAIEQILDSQVNQRLLKAYELRGKNPQMPTNINKFHEVYAYKKIEPMLKDIEAQEQFQEKANEIRSLTL
jgi:hypothetical protein